MSTYSASGIEGLDSILNGGLPTGSAILVEGLPGTGKTIFGMQFLYHGAVDFGEPGIFITFEEFPDQLYAELKAFGWDLKALERENKLRVVCISPDILMEQIEKPGGLIEQLMNEIGCRRIVIDSISLFQFAAEDLKKSRKTLYTLRNILRKFKITSMLVQESNSAEQSEVPFVNYLVDGVIRLSLKSHMNEYRKRTLEVLKMRGCQISEGEHIYRINEQGIHLIPALSMVEDRAVLQTKSFCNTGIAKLDEHLAGGIPKGSCFILDTNSKANYKYIIASIICNRLIKGDKVALLLSSISDLYDIRHLYKLFGVDLDEYVKDGKVFFIEHYDRPIPRDYETAVIKAGIMDNEQFRNIMSEKLGNASALSSQTGEEWFIYYDLNTIVSQRGKDFVNKYFAEEVSKISSSGMSMLALSNFTEIGHETASFLERTSHGVIKTWVDGRYQYLQVLKSPQGSMSSPFLIENILTKPFIRLV